MKGIVLAGGKGTRLYPLTKVISKQLLPVYDKPLIYYPLSVLMLAGIREILIISTPEDIPRFESFFGDGHEYGLQISYKVQANPNGLAEAFILGEDFIGDDDVCMILGDNIFYGHEFVNFLKKAVSNIEKDGGGLVFGYRVKDPERYGVVEFDDTGKAVSIEEKPQNPKSNYAVVGVYLYDNSVVNTAKNLKPSPRGELEITDVNKIYLQQNKLQVMQMGRGFAWFDTGTHESLLDAAYFVKTIEERQGVKISCIEEIAYLKGWITKEQLSKLAEDLNKNQYGEYLKGLLK
jgi:glucose-1-phosphate thymidylyltransferase